MRRGLGPAPHAAGSLALAALLLVLAAREILERRHRGLLLLGGVVLAGWCLIEPRLARRPAGLGLRLAMSVAVLLAVVGVFWLGLLAAPPSALAVALVLVVLAPVALFAPVVERAARRGHRGVALVVIAAGLLSIGLLGSSLTAGFGLIDDHEVLAFLGADGRLRLAEVVPTLISTEVGRFGESARYRPVYYALRVAETFLWQDSPALWYGARLVQFAAGVSLLWLALRPWTGLVGGGAVVLLALTERFWGDVWCRLGPSECYVFVGAALYLWGASGLVARRARCGRRWLAVAAGGALAMGSKENMLVLVLPTIVLAGWCHRRGRSSRLGALALATIGIFGLVIAASLTLGLASHGRDIYESPASAEARLEPAVLAARGAFRAAGGWEMLAGLAVLVAGCRFSGLAGRTRRVVRLGACALVGLTLLVVTEAAQVAFYAGVPSAGTRYEFPRALLPYAACVLAAVVGLRVARAVGMDHAVVRGARAGLVVGAGLLVLDRGFAPLVQACAANAETTRSNAGRLDAIAASLRRQSAWPLVIVYHAPRDLEPLVGVRVLLRHRGVQNPLFVQAGATVRAPNGALERRLIADLARLSREGGGGFAPLPELDCAAGCFALGLSGAADERWTNLGTIP